MQHLDQLREYYSVQQQMFEKELDKTRNQLTRVDAMRFKAEKELMYLQQKAKEKKTWDIIDQTPFLPIIEDDRIFKTTKFANQNLTEAEKRQLLLQEYYRNDKARAAIRQLYNTNIDDQNRVPELPTETQLIFPKIHAQATQVFDESLIRDLQSMRQREEEITKRLQAQDTTQIKNASEYQRMLENQTILPILMNMRNEGQRSAVTPQEKPPLIPEGVKKLRSEGDAAQATFLDDLRGDMQEEMRNTQQQFDLEFTEGNQRTEELILNESEIPVLQEQPFEYDEQEQTLQEPPDPLDENIDHLLNNIHQIVTQDRNTVQNQAENAIRSTLKQATQKDYSVVKKKPPGFKEIKFARTPLVKLEPVKVKIVQPKQQEALPDDNLERLDKLISNLAI